MCLNIITREAWHARVPPLWPPDLETPVSHVFCCYSGTFLCQNRRSCGAQVKKLQKFHIYQKSLRDIRYNFLLGGDGNVYEGRGWLYASKIENDMNLNCNSIIVALIGVFRDRDPPGMLFEMLEKFIEHGIRSGFIKKNYKQHFPSA